MYVTTSASAFCSKIILIVRINLTYRYYLEDGMSRSRYSVVEALNRWLRALEGKAVASDSDEIPGEVLSENDAWSDIAELFEGSLPGETLTLPASGLDYATAEEMYLGVSQDTVVSPYRAEFLNVYGGIYTWTGTAQLTGMSASSYTKITGAFD